jgi:hypothetical protein
VTLLVLTVCLCACLPEQLKADPGVWSIRLAEGRAKDLYEMVQEGPSGETEKTPR